MRGHSHTSFGRIGKVDLELKCAQNWKIEIEIDENPSKIAGRGGAADPLWEIFQFFTHYNSRSTLPILPKFVWELPRMLVYAQKNFGAMGLLPAPGIWKKPRVVIFFFNRIMVNPWFFDPPSEILRYIYIYITCFYLGLSLLINEFLLIRVGN